MVFCKPFLNTALTLYYQSHVSHAYAKDFSFMFTRFLERKSNVLKGSTALVVVFRLLGTKNASFSS